MRIASFFERLIDTKNIVTIKRLIHKGDDLVFEDIGDFPCWVDNINTIKCKGVFKELPSMLKNKIIRKYDMIFMRDAAYIIEDVQNELIKMLKIEKGDK